MSKSDQSPEPAEEHAEPFAILAGVVHRAQWRSALRVCAIGALALVLVSLGIAVNSRRAIEQRLAGLAVEIAEEIFDTGSHGRLLLYAHPKLFTYTPELDWPSRLFEQRARLGQLQSLDSLTANFEQGLLSARFDSAPNSVSYRISSRFETGPAVVEIVFAEQGSEWLVAQLRIESEALKL